ncbi:guanine nucleotide exchange factor [Dactylonectria macrodidyma]|uniref:Guanine nucleotide exchange factor n=1 Tax=Dactylonectria macrodidyma TaxID=307937 RepID=A0A9P9FQ97_9HYPO|nr:guanine nucleotide exchange factor [Dactylonectria macrodidyma]
MEGRLDPTLTLRPGRNSERGRRNPRGPRGWDGEREELLQRLLYRTKSATDQVLHLLFAKRGVCALGRYAFGNSAFREWRTALRCLTSVLLRSIPSRQVFVDEGYAKQTISLMKDGAPDDELYTASILLHCSTGTNLDLGPNFEHDDLAGIINRNVARHGEAASQPSSSLAMSGTATLALLSTLSLHYETQAYRFLDSLASILDVLDKAPINTPPLQSPITSLVACLASIPIQASQSFPESAVDKLTDILDSSITAYGAGGGRELMSLFIALLRLAQSESTGAQTRLRARLLRSGQDKAASSSQEESLPHKLIHLATQSPAPEVRGIAMVMLFELSNKDESEFERNVGSDNAVRFLASTHVQPPQNDLTEEKKA